MSGPDTFQTGQEAAGPGQAKPRLVLMGEFSAGKSTLSNLLLGGPMLPTQVTATRLPPVHVSAGDRAAFAIGHDGERRPVDLTDLSGLTPENVRSIHLTMQSDTLELCDLVDMPGISDPNMAVDTWDEVLTRNDHVVWCTHATQAWRQSEAALWGRLVESTRGANLLLITQFDKLRSPRDKERVLSRVQKEVGGLFSAVYPMSLLEALDAGENFEAWKASGAHDFMEHLIDILVHRGDTAERLVGATVTRAQGQSRSRQTEVSVLRPAAGSAAGSPVETPSQDPATAPAAERASPVRIMPRRVRVKEGADRTARPSRAEAEAMMSEQGPGAA